MKPGAPKKKRRLHEDVNELNDKANTDVQRKKSTIVATKRQGARPKLSLLATLASKYCIPDLDIAYKKLYADYKTNNDGVFKQTKDVIDLIEFAEAELAAFVSARKPALMETVLDDLLRVDYAPDRTAALEGCMKDKKSRWVIRFSDKGLGSFSSAHAHNSVQSSTRVV